MDGFAHTWRATPFVGQSRSDRPSASLAGVECPVAFGSVAGRQPAFRLAAQGALPQVVLIVLGETCPLQKISISLYL